MQNSVYFSFDVHRCAYFCCASLQNSILYFRVDVDSIQMLLVLEIQRILHKILKCDNIVESIAMVGVSFQFHVPAHSGIVARCSKTLKYSIGYDCHWYCHHVCGHSWGPCRYNRWGYQGHQVYLQEHQECAQQTSKVARNQAY